MAPLEMKVGAMAGRYSRKVVRPAVDTEAVKLLRDNPTGYFEKERSRDRVPFGFVVSDSSKAKSDSSSTTTDD